MSLISGDEAKFPPGCMDNRQMPVGCRGAGVAASNLSEQSNKTRGIKMILNQTYLLTTATVSVAGPLFCTQYPNHKWSNNVEVAILVVSVLFGKKTDLLEH